MKCEEKEVEAVSVAINKVVVATASKVLLSEAHSIPLKHPRTKNNPSYHPEVTSVSLISVYSTKCLY